MLPECGCLVATKNRNLIIQKKYTQAEVWAHRKISAHRKKYLQKKLHIKNFAHRNFYPHTDSLATRIIEVCAFINASLSLYVPCLLAHSSVCTNYLQRFFLCVHLSIFTMFCLCTFLWCIFPLRIFLETQVLVRCPTQM